MKRASLTLYTGPASNGMRVLMSEALLDLTVNRNVQKFIANIVKSSSMMTKLTSVLPHPKSSPKCGKWQPNSVKESVTTDAIVILHQKRLCVEKKRGSLMWSV